MAAAFLVWAREGEGASLPGDADGALDSWAGWCNLPRLLVAPDQFMQWSWLVRSFFSLVPDLDFASAIIARLQVAVKTICCVKDVPANRTRRNRSRIWSCRKQKQCHLIAELDGKFVAPPWAVSKGLGPSSASSSSSSRLFSSCGPPSRCQKIQRIEFRNSPPCPHPPQ